MAQPVTYAPHGCLRIEADTTYDYNNVPTTSDVVILNRGVRILDENGDKTPLRGVRMLVEVTGLTTTTPLPNVPMIWYEGDEMHFLPTGTYTFLDNGLVSYGLKVAV